MLSLGLLVAPLALLGAGEKVIALTIVYSAVHALLQHSNVDVRLGPLNWIFSMAEVHRWHHSRDLGESNANYGQTLLVCATETKTSGDIATYAAALRAVLGTARAA